jgi:hypothetical protein
MKTHVEECRDKITGEVNHTKLSEMTADELNIFVDYVDYQIPQEIFEISLEFK